MRSTFSAMKLNLKPTLNQVVSRFSEHLVVILKL